MKIAVIGTGIAGLGAAYGLYRDHDITVFEKNAYAGGHSRTITIRDGQDTLPVDTGFIVFNKRNYPLLTGLFEHLQVPVIESDMSFGVSIGQGQLEYSSKGLFAQKRNLLKPAYWQMLRDILRFNKTVLKMQEKHQGLTLGEFLDVMKIGSWARQYYIQAMGAAIWSCSVETILGFPAESFLRFFDNHGLLTVNGHPQWYTVKGGSREYVARLTAPFADKIRLNCGAVRVRRNAEGVAIVDTHGEISQFDHVIFACHADQALQMMTDADADERAILGSFEYQENRVVVHSDASFMPTRRGAWASWIYLSDAAQDKKPVVSLSYWMNLLQNFKTQKPVIVTLNPAREPDFTSIHNDHLFDHPVFTLKALAAQKRIADIQGRGGIWHCGAYQRYGFHEDGLMSAVAVVRALGAEMPWI